MPASNRMTSMACAHSTRWAYRVCRPPQGRCRIAIRVQTTWPRANAARNLINAALRRTASISTIVTAIAAASSARINARHKTPRERAFGANSSIAFVPRAPRNARPFAAAAAVRPVHPPFPAEMAHRPAVRQVIRALEGPMVLEVPRAHGAKKKPILRRQRATDRARVQWNLHPFALARFLAWARWLWA